MKRLLEECSTALEQEMLSAIIEGLEVINPSKKYQDRIIDIILSKSNNIISRDKIASIVASYFDGR